MRPSQRRLRRVAKERADANVRAREFAWISSTRIIKGDHYLLINTHDKQKYGEIYSGLSSSLWSAQATNHSVWHHDRYVDIQDARRTVESANDLGEVRECSLKELKELASER